VPSGRQDNASAGLVSTPPATILAPALDSLRLFNGCAKSAVIPASTALVQADQHEPALARRSHWLVMYLPGEVTHEHSSYPRGQRPDATNTANTTRGTRFPPFQRGLCLPNFSLSLFDLRTEGSEGAMKRSYQYGASVRVEVSTGASIAFIRSSTQVGLSYRYNRSQSVPLVLMRKLPFH
jgi:hypothetical protein